jgi:2-polyprenyl-3-methyl-5-hydroxy-6-metoxy-1,4-benzoquinol methylase
MIYQRRYDQLIKICKQIKTHRQNIAKYEIEKLVFRDVDATLSSEDLLTHLIAESLLKRIDQKLLESKNIYVQQLDIPQIVMFYNMARAVPFVDAGHFIANQYMANIIEGLSEATVFDIGIGKGVQLKALCRMLASSKNSLKSLSIIGLDPDEKNLVEFERETEKMRNEFPFTLSFHPVNGLIEDLSAEHYDEIRRMGAGNLLVNSSFAFHHTAHPVKDTELRTELFRKIAGMRPLLFTLVEPNSNHDTEELPRRLHFSWQHFGCLFHCIDQSDLDPSQKFQIKEKFFGREIRDIFGVSDRFRCERHEMYDSWLLRLNRAGLRPFDRIRPRVDLPVGCAGVVTEGLVRLNYNETTLVAVFAYSL